jgi:hypothetical protein
VIGVLLYTRPASVTGIVGNLPLPVAAPVPSAPAAPAPEPELSPREPALAALAPVAGAAAPSEGGSPADVPAGTTVDPTAEPRPAPTPAPPVGAQFGGFRVSSPIELQVWENGQLLGSTAGPIAVSDGTHTIELVNEALGFRLRQPVDVKPGRLTTVNVSAPNGRVSINAAPWADVWIDGAAAGQTPLANVSLPIGTHEIVFRHPQFGEQRQQVVVKVDGLTRVSAVLQR